MGEPGRLEAAEQADLKPDDVLLAGALDARLIVHLDQGFRHRIGLAEQLQDALMIERRQFAVLAPFEGGAVQLIHLEGPALGHGKERHGGPPTAMIKRP